MGTWRTLKVTQETPDRVTVEWNTMPLLGVLTLSAILSVPIGAMLASLYPSILPGLYPFLVGGLIAAAMVSAACRKRLRVEGGNLAWSNNLLRWEHTWQAGQAPEVVLMRALSGGRSPKLEWHVILRNASGEEIEISRTLPLEEAQHLADIVATALAVSVQFIDFGERGP